MGAANSRRIPPTPAVSPPAVLSVLCLALLLVGLGARAGAASAADWRQGAGDAWIDWTAAVAEATGRQARDARPEGDDPARERLLAEAERRARLALRDVLMPLQVDARRDLAAVAAADPAAAGRIDAMIEAAAVTRQDFDPGEGARVTVALPLTGALSQLVLPAEIRQVEPIRPVGESRRPSTDAQGFTGLLVDARGIDLRPALVLTLRDESGAEVYGPAFVSREFVVQWGMCRYSGDLEAARRRPRIGDRPLVVRALRSAGPHRTELIISNTDAASLRGVSVNLGFLRACRVVVAGDPPEKTQESD